MKIEFERKNTLSNYYDWYHKALVDLDTYKKTLGVYDLADCFLTLNALPEWIANSTIVVGNLKKIAESKLEIMKGQNFKFDENQMDNIDQKLRFIRIFCNHAKHSARKEVLPKISMSFMLPATLPVSFTYVQIGNINIEALKIVCDVVDFWESIIGERPVDN